MAENKGVITVVGRKKICMAHSGDASLPAIVKMAWGDGGGMGHTDFSAADYCDYSLVFRHLFYPFCFFINHFYKT